MCKKPEKNGSPDVICDDCILAFRELLRRYCTLRYYNIDYFMRSSDGIRYHQSSSIAPWLNFEQNNSIARYAYLGTNGRIGWCPYPPHNNTEPKSSLHTYSGIGMSDWLIRLNFRPHHHHHIEWLSFNKNLSILYPAYAFIETACFRIAYNYDRISYRLVDPGCLFSEAFDKLETSNCCLVASLCNFLPDDCDISWCSDLGRYYGRWKPTTNR